MPWLLTMVLLLAGLAVHVYGLSLRWYILDRIPVANMFEAVVASASIGIALALLIELFLKTRVFLVGAAATEFMALLAGGYVLPGSELGTITGAWWADYSWGRPWGWDPKEVFALNTWIIYAILIHVRFVVRERGLWTAWLSILGCAMMAFNWFFMNFFMASVHSCV